MTGKLGQAERLILEELHDVNEQLEGFEPLRSRKAGLEAALNALRRAANPGDARPSIQPLSVARQAAANEAAQPTSPSNAALVILGDADRPLHIREIVEALWGRGWYKDRTYESLRGTIAGTLNIKDKNGEEVEKVGASVYRLRPTHNMTQPDLALGGAGPG